MLRKSRILSTFSRNLKKMLSFVYVNNKLDNLANNKKQ